MPASESDTANPQTPDAPDSPGAATAVAPKPARPAPQRRRKPKKLPPWNVVLLDDDQHTYAYVIEMLCRVCAHSPQRSMKMAQEVDSRGRVIVYTAHRELAELKRDQITGFGADPRVASCQGSMTAILEPAEPQE